MYTRDIDSLQPNLHRVGFEVNLVIATSPKKQQLSSLAWAQVMRLGHYIFSFSFTIGKVALLWLLLLLLFVVIVILLAITIGFTITTQPPKITDFDSLTY